MTALFVIGGLVLFILMVAWLGAPPPTRCRYCGKRFGPDHIPPEIRAAGRAATGSDPIWYAGRTYCPNYVRKKTLADLAAESRATVSAPKERAQ